MFWVRLASSVVLLAVTVTVMILGGYPLFIYLLALSLIGMMEFYRLMGKHKSLPAAAAYLCALAYWLLLFFAPEVSRIIAPAALLVALLGIFVFTYPKYEPQEITHIFFGMVYVCVMLSCLWMIRMLPAGNYLVWLAFICAWGCDTCAYCVGMLIGKHKMTPVLSPKKSVEGAIGGVLGAGLLGMAYALIFGDKLTILPSPVSACIIIGMAGGALSMVGDLAASAFKRHYGIKDYGKLIPGHGGVLDRFDSILITAPVTLGCILLLAEVMG